MNENLYEEDLSISYLRAIAAKAQIVFELRNRDVNSKDANLTKTITTPYGQFDAELNVQLKSTYSKSLYTDNGHEIVYTLKAKNYNDLCRKTTTPIILCLLILPENKDEWVEQTSEDLTLRRCMYWLSLKGRLPTTNTSTCNVTIPKTNIVTAETLNHLLNKIAENGGEL